MSRRQSITAIAYDKHGIPVSVGNNSYYKTHVIQARYANKVGKPGAIYLHAEIDALIKSRGKPIYKLFVSRFDRNGKPALAKPCSICMAAIKDYGVKVVEYTDKEG